MVGDDGSEPEPDPNAQTAHSKGLIAFDPIQGKGFWLTHSVHQYCADDMVGRIDGVNVGAQVVSDAVSGR